MNQVPEAMPACFKNWCRRFDELFSRQKQRQDRSYLGGLPGESQRQNLGHRKSGDETTGVGRYYIITVVIALLVTACIARSSSNVSQTQPESAWALLQRGDPGYVVMMRHALAPGTGDPADFKIGDCTTQRNLSSEGREQAVRIGKAFRSRNIRIARVLSSQWCRCKDTARLMNLGRVETFVALNSFFNASSREDGQTAEVRRFILSKRDIPGATIMVTHQVNITGLTGIVPQAGESVVLRANEQGQVKVVGRLLAL